MAGSWGAGQWTRSIKELDRIVRDAHALLPELSSGE
jgi:hypothetical protein